MQEMKDITIDAFTTYNEQWTHQSAPTTHIQKYDQKIVQVAKQAPRIQNVLQTTVQEIKSTPTVLSTASLITEIQYHRQGWIYTPSTRWVPTYSTGKKGKTHQLYAE